MLFVPTSIAATRRCLTPAKPSEALLVRLETDAGLVGWGESGSGTVPRAGATFIEDHLAPLAIGMDPFDLDALNQKVHATLDRAGWTGDFAVQCWSGLEVAIWDVMGKAIGRPVSQLLGGRVRERIMAYATGLYYAPTAPDPSRARQDEARGYVERGYRAMKMKVGGLTPGEDIQEVAGIRKTIGDHVLLVILPTCFPPRWTGIAPSEVPSHSTVGMPWRLNAASRSG